VDNFVACLRGGGLTPTAEDLADIFWLATHLNPQAEGRAAAEEEEEEDGALTEDRGRIEPSSSPDLAEPPLPLYDPQGWSDEATPAPGAGTPIAAPGAPALRGQLDIGRALRPLMRRVPSRTQTRFDEEATAQQIAEQQIWLPVLRPAPERWYELAIVVEDGASAPLWQDTVGELRRLTERLGAFRRVTAWRLGQGEDQPLGLAADPGNTAADCYPRSVKELIDPAGRRLIWLLSDCTSALWRQRALYDWLRDCGQQAPITLVQFFPESLWRRTEVGRGFVVPLRALEPGQPSGQLRPGPKPVAWYLQDEPEITATLPLVTLEPEALKSWAKLVAGSGQSQAIGVQFAVAVATRSRGGAAGGRVLSPRERVQRFLNTASPLAGRLAGLMAAAPVSLPVVQVIQQALLPQSNQVHVAEVYMMQSVETGFNDSRYDFLPGVRECLVGTMPMDQTQAVLDTVSAEIGRRLGRSIKTFEALLLSRQPLDGDGQKLVKPFAEIAVTVLRRLGGTYAALAEQIAAPVAPLPLREMAGPGWPPLQPLTFETVRWVPEEEPEEAAEAGGQRLEVFEFETAVVQRQGQGRQVQWQVQRQPGQGRRYVERLGDVSLEMVAVPEGVFLMGSPEEEPERLDREGPQHEVRVPSFFMGRYPVTQGQWRFVAGLPQVEQVLEPEPARFKGEMRPVERVNWWDAVEFCLRLSRYTGREYRLPTEAEWEYACRAGTTTPFCFGETLTPALANYDGNYVYNGGPKGIYREETTEVGTFPANPWGLQDMHGNVWEWCADHWHDNYADAPTDGRAWLTDDDSARRVRRGGSWVYYPRYCRAACRDGNFPRVSNYVIGFRVSCSAPRTLR
jgi:formylglycine-generating enzyme required for sulfatase activity